MHHPRDARPSVVVPTDTKPATKLPTKYAAGYGGASRKKPPRK